MRKLLLISTAAVALAGAAGNDSYAETITENFEAGGPAFSFSASIGAAAGIASSPTYNSTKSVHLSIPSGMLAASVSVDVSSHGLTLGDLTSADYWVYLASGKDINAPYIYFPVKTPHSTAYVVMFNPPDMGINLASSTWTDITVNPDTTPFHVANDTTGIPNPNDVTLAELSAMSYSAGTTWGSLPINLAAIEVGQEGDALSSEYYVDDLTIDATVPEPASMALLGVGLLGLGFIRQRRRYA